MCFHGRKQHSFLPSGLGGSSQGGAHTFVVLALGVGGRRLQGQGPLYSPKPACAPLVTETWHQNTTWDIRWRVGGGICCWCSCPPSWISLKLNLSSGTCQWPLLSRLPLQNAVSLSTSPCSQDWSLYCWSWFQPRLIPALLVLVSGRADACTAGPGFPRCKWFL